VKQAPATVGTGESKVGSTIDIDVGKGFSGNGTDFLSASRRIVTICSSVNRVFFKRSS
jgi:hypothetical protein